MVGKSRSGRGSQEAYSLFETPIGGFGIAWTSRGLSRLQLPESDRVATVRRLASSVNGGEEADPPPRIAEVIARIRAYLGGDPTDFSTVVLDLDMASPFHRKVYDAARSIGWGKTASYGDLARLAGSPAAARAVGQALSRNPVAIVIPCHRILASGQRLGGFTAFGGTSAKEGLLALEGVQLSPGPTVRSRRVGRSWDADEAVRTLSAADPALGNAIREGGPFRLECRTEVSPFDRLAEAIIHQQLTVKAAATILARVKEALAGVWTPAAILDAELDVLRSAGLSQAKAAALRALAEKTQDGTIPELREMRRMTDDAIVARLTNVRGVGRWTAQMFLIFALDRPDVMPAEDYGLRRGFQVVFETPDVPTPAEVLARAERWRPYRTVASWYLWRAADRSQPRRS